MLKALTILLCLAFLACGVKGKPMAPLEPPMIGGNSKRAQTQAPPKKELNKKNEKTGK
jgi:hypothetical protein